MPTITIDTKSQPFYSTLQPEPDVVVLHSTEGMGWPGYNGGGSAPNDTIRAIPGKGIHVRKHIDYSRFGKALMNLSGGVQTNRRGAIQIELVGTCDPKHKDNPIWFYWPEADDVVLQALADYLRPAMTKYKIPAKAPKFLAYPSSYGNKQGQRFTFSEWNAFEGVCGHQHVPENTHGDPGNMDVPKLLRMIAGDRESAPAKATTVNSVPAGSLLSEDGVLDKGTKAAIQRMVGVKGDGVWGPITRKAIQKWAGATQDGDLGPATRKAVQKKVGHAQTGVWNLTTLRYDSTTKAIEAYYNRAVRARGKGF